MLTHILNIKTGDRIIDPAGTGHEVEVLVAYRPDHGDGTRCLTLAYPEGSGCAYVKLDAKVEVVA